MSTLTNPPVCVIPPTNGPSSVPLRTFLFMYMNKGVPQRIRLYSAESEVAICTYWCQGGADAPKLKRRGVYIDQLQATPQEFLAEVGCGHLGPKSRYYILEELEQPTLIPTTNEIRTELSSFILPELAEIILDLMQPDCTSEYADEEIESEDEEVEEEDSD